jgi:hypothetical protein
VKTIGDLRRAGPGSTPCQSPEHISIGELKLDHDSRRVFDSASGVARVPHRASGHSALRNNFSPWRDTPCASELSGVTPFFSRQDVGPRCQPLSCSEKSQDETPPRAAGGSSARAARLRGADSKKFLTPIFFPRLRAENAITTFLVPSCSSLYVGYSTQAKEIHRLVRNQIRGYRI